MLVGSKADLGRTGESNENQKIQEKQGELFHRLINSNRITEYPKINNSKVYSDLKQMFAAILSIINLSISLV